MKKFLTLFTFVWLQILNTQAQNCNNIGFENGHLTNWVLINGNVTDNNAQTLYSPDVIGTTDNEHIVTQVSDGNDLRITDEVMPMVAPGSSYSVRFGNFNKGGKFDRIKNTFTVTSANTLLQYRFAVVLQKDANGHATFQKPGFYVRLYDASGQSIACTFYDVQLQTSGSLDGFKTQGDLEYRNWTTVAVDLRAYIGQKLTLEATVHGCTKMRHYGYAYFDASCLKAEVKPENGVSCPDANGDIVLEAPDGFEKYTWSDGQTTRSIKVQAILGKKYSVKLVPINSLNDNCGIDIDYFLKNFVKEKEEFKTICEGEEVNFRGSKYSSSGTYTKTIGNGGNCDSLITLDLYVNPKTRINQDINLCEGEKFEFRGKTYTTTDTYIQNFSSAETCDSVFTFNVTVTPLARVFQNTVICAGEKIKVGDSTYAKSGTYITTIKRTAKCDSVVTTKLVVENAFTITSSPDVSIEKGDSVLLQALVQPAAKYVYDWTPKEGLACASCASTWAKPSTSMVYVVSAVIENGKCFKKAQTLVAVSCGLYLPTAFSPNNDRINDIFKIEGSRCIKTIIELTIYNRWGEAVYRDTNYSPFDSSHGWDGTFQGTKAFPDAYAYKVVAEMKNGEIYNTTGSVTLLR